MEKIQRLIEDKEQGIKVFATFDKQFLNDRYEILYNSKTGFEVIRGIKGSPDPFSLDLPVLLDIGIMGHCENRCRLCYQGDDQQKNMQFRSFTRIIDEIKDHVTQVALGGRGDPNLHKDFEKILEYCRENNITPNYTTSGNGLTKRQVEVSKLCGGVAVSDYRQEFSFKALRMFIEAGVKTNIHFIFSNQSYYEAVKLAYGYNVWKSWYGKRHNMDPFDFEKLNGIVMLLFKPQGRAKSMTHLIPSKPQLEHVSEVLMEYHPRPFKIGMDSCLANHAIKNSELNPLQQATMDTCEGGKSSAYISPDMKMLPCSFAHPALGVPLRKKSISDVWNESEEFKTFRKQLFRWPSTCPLGL